MRSAIKQIAFKKLYGAEIGVAAGGHAVEMLNAMPGLDLILVDPYVPYFTETEREKTEALHIDNKTKAHMIVDEFKDRARFMEMPSTEAAKCFADKYFDFVYIDGDHSETEVIKDIVAWKPKIKTGGYLCGHDFDIVGDYVTTLLPDVSHDPMPMTNLKSDWWVRL